MKRLVVTRPCYSSVGPLTVCSVNETFCCIFGHWVIANMHVLSSLVVCLGVNWAIANMSFFTNACMPDLTPQPQTVY